MHTTNKLGFYFFIAGVFLSVTAYINLWTSEHNAITRSILSAEKEVNARLETAASISRILSEQMEKNLTGNEETSGKLDIYNDAKNNFWYSDIKSESSDEDKLMGILSGIGNFNNIDNNVKKEINSALKLQINLSSTAYKNTYSWVYYLSNNKFIYIYPKVSREVYHLHDFSYEKISWKYAGKYKTQMTEPYFDAAGTGFIISFLSSVYKNNQFRGVVGVDINLKYISKLIKDYGVDGDYYVITNKGIIVTSTTSNTLGKNIDTIENIHDKNSIASIVDTESDYKLRIINSGSIWMVAERIYSRLVLILVLNIVFLYTLYLVVSYFITRNDITKKNLIYALKNNQFIPYAQPIISTETEKVVGCEILIRWFHPIKGIIPPDVFISLSETSGVIIPMTYQLMEKVSLHFSKHLSKLPSDFHIAINICPEHLSENTLLEQCQFFTERLANKVRLVLEITERGNFKFSSHIKDNISTLLNAGVRFSLDDFGTGYSTHSYLQKVHAEYIKIDRTFTKMIGRDEISHHIVNNVVNLAENINAKVIAEGVETVEQAEYLKRKKIPYMQGYFYGKPVPLDEFTSLFL